MSKSQESLTSGQIEWKLMSNRDRNKRIAIEIEAARIAKCVDEYQCGHESAAIFPGWLSHELDLDLVPYSVDLEVGWLAREIFLTIDQCDRSIDDDLYGERCRRQYGHSGDCR